MADSVIRLRAGVAQYDEETQICTPVPVQGEIRIKRSVDDEQEDGENEDMGFWDFEWVPLEKPADPEAVGPISLILIPGETAWVPIRSCQNGRLFALVFSSEQKYFFWLQEKNPASLALNELNTKEQAVYDQMTKALNVSATE